MRHGPINVWVRFVKRNGEECREKVILPEDAREWFGNVFSDILLRDHMRQSGTDVKKVIAFTEHFQEGGST